MTDMSIRFHSEFRGRILSVFCTAMVFPVKANPESVIVGYPTEITERGEHAVSHSSNFIS